jgi:hypothetical protein
MTFIGLAQATITFECDDFLFWSIAKIYHLKEIKLEIFRRLMFKNQFDTSFVGFTQDGAKWLVENTDIKLIGKLLINLLQLNIFHVRSIV